MRTTRTSKAKKKGRGAKRVQGQRRELRRERRRRLGGEAPRAAAAAPRCARDEAQRRAEVAAPRRARDDGAERGRRVGRRRGAGPLDGRRDGRRGRHRRSDERRAHALLLRRGQRREVICIIERRRRRLPLQLRAQVRGHGVAERVVVAPRRALDALQSLGVVSFCGRDTQGCCLLHGFLKTRTDALWRKLVHVTRQAFTTAFKIGAVVQLYE
jgi:hypothetical protein